VKRAGTVATDDERAMEIFSEPRPRGEGVRRMRGLVSVPSAARSRDSVPLLTVLFIQQRLSSFLPLQ